jgi:protein gp37
MGAKTEISWTDSTWNPLRGCSRVSEGCRNCYAEKMAARFSGIGQPYEGLAEMVGCKAHWTGKVDLVKKHLLDPLKWGMAENEDVQEFLTLGVGSGLVGAMAYRPRRIFVNSMSDLFHENVSDEMRDRIIAVMALCPQHVFQVLTKRPERMLAYFSNREAAIRVLKAKSNIWQGRHQRDESLGLPRMTPDYMLPNLWLGVSVENQASADERIPLLLQTPAAVRFVSCEPLLGPVDLRDGLGLMGAMGDLDWVIAGGESGPGARPMHPDWARGLRDQCAAAGVPFFFKQWGEFTSEQCPGVEVRLDSLNPGQCVTSGIKGHHTLYTRVGKKAAGCLLDGVAHNAFPEVRP